ncbi:DUF4062 domain-containing protein [Bacillus swezeyi]|uniref:DUF4062 domain-containing protein n=1 Tax=Bacillus swezeyi TaxID=1925020 RepID=UPI0039C6AA0F
MKKRLQVFISSTYADLIEERQAAVEAVLNAGHIPAGMELFKSGDQSQKETIKKWIDESDVYMLILGGRYGTIDQETGKSYTHWEYDYAETCGKPRFSIIINDNALDEKVKEKGQDVLEREHYKEYRDFKDTVLSKICKFYSDIKDIKLAIYESLKEFEKDETLVGWVSGNDVGRFIEIKEENHTLLKENMSLKEKVEILEEKVKKNLEFNGYSYEELQGYLQSKLISLPGDIFNDNITGDEISAMDLFLKSAKLFSIGYEFNSGEKVTSFIHYRLTPILLNFGLVEKLKVGTAIKFQLSESGHKFILKLEMDNFQSEC